MKWLVIIIACILCITIVLGVDYRGAISVTTDWVNSIGSGFNKVAGLTGVLSDRNAYLVTLKQGNLGTVNVDDQNYDIASYIISYLIPDLFKSNSYIYDLTLKASPSVYSFTLESVKFNKLARPMAVGIDQKYIHKDYHTDVSAIRIDVNFRTSLNATGMGAYTYHVFVYSYDGEIYYMVCDDTFTQGQLSKRFDTINEFSSERFSYYSIINTPRIILPPETRIGVWGTYEFQYFDIEDFNETTYNISTIMGEIIKSKGVN